MKGMFSKIIFSFSFCLFTCTGLFAQGVKLVDYLPKPIVKDGSVDYTSYLQQGIDKHLVVEFPNFPILINENGLSVRSNQTLNFPEGALLVMKANNLEKYGLLKVERVSNVTINNPALKGDRKKHLGKKGEWGMGIGIRSSIDVTVNNPNISDFWGDGIYVGEIWHAEQSKYRLSDYSSRNIKINGGVIDHNRRNGISVVSAKGVVIDGVLIQNTEGTLPMAGICVEPANNRQSLENVVLRNITTKNNREVGVKYVSSNFVGTRRRNVDVTIENWKEYGAKVGLFLGGARGYKKGTQKLNGNIKINNLDLTNNTIPVQSGRIQEYNPKVSMSSVRIFKGNQRLGTTESKVMMTLEKRGFTVTK